MARPRILDPKIMWKVAKKIGKKDIAAINIMVSKKAAKLGLSAEAALILLAKEYGIGTSTYQRRLDDAKRAEVRDALPTLFANGRMNSQITKSKGRGLPRPTTSKRTSLKLVTEFLIQDALLLNRCQDILLASSNFDRPINQATLVLEDRIRKKSEPNQKLVGENLVNFAFNEDIAKTVLKVVSGDADDQRGFTQIMRGIVPSFRNKTHHHIINSFSREEAISVCGFIDVLLRVVDNSIKVR